MIPVWIWWPALILTIAALGALLLRHTTTTIAAGREGETWRRVRTDVALFCAIVVDLARVFGGHAVRVVAAAVVGLWVADGRHRAGREPSTLQQVAPRRVVEVDFGPVPTVVPRPALPTIGEVARSVRFPADAQEFDRTFGTVEIGATL